MDMTSQLATETPAPKSSLLDPVADLVRERYRRARHWRAVDRIGRYTVDRHCRTRTVSTTVSSIRAMRNWSRLPVSTSISRS